MSTHDWEAATRELIRQTESGRIRWQDDGTASRDATFFRCKIDTYEILFRAIGESWGISFIFSNGCPIWRWPDSGLNEVLRQAILNAEPPPKPASEFLEKFLKNFLS